MAHLTGRVRIAVISDLHVGSTLGLCPKIVYLDDEGKYQQTPLQGLVYQHWDYFWQHVFETDNPIVVISNGDLVEGRHHDLSQLWTTDVDQQAITALELLQPIRQKVRHWFSIRGTSAHGGSAGGQDEQIARELKSDLYDRKYSAYHLKLEISGVHLDIMHHGPAPGRRKWLLGNELRYYTKSTLLECLAEKRQPPHILIRSHVHRATHETIRIGAHTCEALITPAWQLKTEHVYKIVSELDIADIGGTIIDVEDGKILDIRFDLLPVEQAKVKRL